MNIVYDEIPNSEIVHHSESGLLVTSKGNYINLNQGKKLVRLNLPIPLIMRPLYSFRLIRRLLRLDKMNVIVIDNETLKIIIIYQGVVYSSINGEKPAKIFKLEHGRNVLHNSLAKTPEGCLIFGEYYGNNNQDPVNIYRINLSNFDWDIPYTFKSGEIRHVHSCLWDKYSQKIWIFTGDFQDECRVYETGTSFEDFEIIGAGSQQWRAVSAFFTTDFVYWIMDVE